MGLRFRLHAMSRPAAFSTRTKDATPNSGITEEKPYEGPLIPGIKKMAVFAVGAKRELGLGILFLPPALASNMALPYFVGRIVDQIGAGLGAVGEVSAADTSVIQGTILSLLAISMLGAGATALRSYYIHLAGEIVTRDMRNTLFAETVRKKMFFFDKAKSGDLINRLSADTSVVSSTLTESVSILLRSLGTTTLGTCFLVYTSPQLAVVSCLTLLPVALISKFYGTYVKTLTKEKLDILGVATANAQEALGNIRTVVLFSREEHEKAKYGGNIQDSYVVGTKLAVVRAGFMGASNMVISLSMLSVLGYGSTLVASGALSAGTLTTFLLYAANVGASVFSISSVYSSIMRALGACDRIFEITEDRDSNMPPGPPSTNQAAPITAGQIEFKDVSFAYPLRPDQPVLVDLQLTIPPASVVAIVGPSGCGKSTLISLLARFYEPNRGEVLLDGKSIADINLVDLRDRIGTVTQDAAVFSASIWDNIRYGNLEASEEQVYEAARMANAHSFISQFPEGYNTRVGERGAALSGGQKQRICIARAILKNPSILLLDEATSALDVESEWLVQQALDRLMAGRTTFLITHRLSTIQNVDYIAVMEQGHVVEFGPREEVFNNEEGRFAQYLKHVKETALKSTKD